MMGWRVSAARVLALVLALAIAVPTAGLAEDFAFHQGHGGHGQTEFAMAPEATSGAAQDADLGPGAHVHCGCHVAANLRGADPVPQGELGRPSYTLVSETGQSVSPERLSRPPRA